MNKPRTSDEIRCNIAAAVQRVDLIQIHPDLARIFVRWFGQYAELARQRYGCPPDGLLEAQQILAEACAARSDSHAASIGALAAEDVSHLEHGLVDTKTAAAVLDVKPTTIRWHFKKRNLRGQKVGETLMISSSSLAELLAEREGRKSSGRKNRRPAIEGPGSSRVAAQRR